MRSVGRSVPVSVLLPETRALLRGVKPAAPRFSNMILAELFDAVHTRGHLKVLQRTDGPYIVFDADAPNGEGVLAGPFAKAEKALEELKRIEKTRKGESADGKPKTRNETSGPSVAGVAGDRGERAAVR